MNKMDVHGQAMAFMLGNPVSCNEALPEYMIPDEIIFREDLPRTDRGKVDYRALEREATKQQGGS